MANTFLRYTLAPLLRTRVQKVVGLENLPREGGCVIAVNHVSYLDPPTIALVLLHEWKTLPYFLTKKRVADLFGSYISKHWLSMLPIDPKRPGAALDPALAHLHGGGTICVFPEGTRNWKDTLLTGKTGAVRLALDARVPIIPIGYHGPLGRTTGESLRNLFFTRSPIWLKIGSPMHLDEHYDTPVTRDLLYDLTDDVMRRIGELSGKRFQARDERV